MTEWRHKT